MKWLKAGIGLLVLGGFAYGVWYVREKRIEVPFIGEIERPVEVKEGLEVPLVLLTPLHSGGSQEGDAVKLIVAEDVISAGKVVVAQGAVATAKVVRSRAGTVVGALTNMPARLEIELLDVKAVDGRPLQIRSLEVKEPYAFVQANTRWDEKSGVLDAVSDPAAREFFVGLANQVATGKKMSDTEKSKADDRLKDLAGKYGLESTTAFFKGEKGKSSPKKDVAGLLESVQRGDVSGLAGPELLLAAKAASEIVDIGAGIDKSLRGIFKGNNIHARVGTPVKAYLAETSSVKPVKSTDPR